MEYSLKCSLFSVFSHIIITLLENHGVSLKEERGNRIFPESDRAETVVQGLLNQVKASNVRVKGNSSVKQLLLKEKKVTGLKALVDNKEVWFNAPKVIIATGGKAYPATGSAGD